MDKALLRLLLPEGILDYFTVVKIEKASVYTVHLEEENIIPDEFKNAKLTSKGFYEPITVQDFPLRGKACYLRIKRRRWFNETTDQIVSRDWKLVAKGTRMTDEFASFLKGAIG